MALTIQTKQPAESRLYNFDFGGLMVTGETIASISGVTATPSGLTVGSTAISGQIAQVRLSGGTGATEYLLTCTVVTSASNTLELEGRLWVEDIAPLSADEQAALDQLVIMTQSALCPALDYTTTVAELRVILTKHQRATVWATGMAYAIGARIIPTAANRNGHHFIAVRYTATATDQMSGATEPAWTTTMSAEYTDNHVVWREAGWDWDGVRWDLTAAAQQAWLTKAAKASVTSDTRVGDLNISSSQLFDHCIAMAKQYQRNYVI